MNFFSLFKKRKGASEWSSIYLLVVVVIGVILLVTLVKPTLNAAANAATGGGQEAKAIAAIGPVLYSKLKGK